MNHYFGHYRIAQPLEIHVEPELTAVLGIVKVKERIGLVDFMKYETWKFSGDED